MNSTTIAKPTQKYTKIATANLHQKLNKPPDFTVLSRNYQMDPFSEHPQIITHLETPPKIVTKSPPTTRQKPPNHTPENPNLTPSVTQLLTVAEALHRSTISKLDSVPSNEEAGAAHYQNTRTKLHLRRGYNSRGTIRAT